MTSQEQNTIEQLLQRKEYLKKEIHKSGSCIANDWKMLFTPPARTARCSIGSIKRKGRLLYMMVS